MAVSERTGDSLGGNGSLIRASGPISQQSAYQLNHRLKLYIVDELWDQTDPGYRDLIWAELLSISHSQILDALEPLLEDP